MVVPADIVSYFRSLKSYERIGIMCNLQHSCLPLELRFLGTCLEELGRKDFHELRSAENEANSSAEICMSELRKISNKDVQKKIILYLSLLHSNNYSCSYALYKILCNAEEVCKFLNHEDDDDVGSEQLLMIYTLAVNHPAFSCEQKEVLRNIFKEVEKNKRSNSKNSVNQPSVEQSESPLFASSISVQECQLQISTSPENTFPTQPLPNPSHLPTIPPPYPHDMSIPMHEQITMGLQPPNFVRFPFPPWNGAATAIPAHIVFTTTEQTATTHSFMSRSSSPSISNSPSRSSSPSAKARPLSAPFVRSPQLTGILPHQPASLPLPHTTVDPFVEMINKDSSNLPVNAPNFASEQLYRRTDEELSAIGMTEDNIQQIRGMIVNKRLSSDDSLSTQSVDKVTPNGAEVEVLKDFVESSVPRADLLYAPAIHAAVDPNTALFHNATCNYCTNHMCVQNSTPQINGYVPPVTSELSGVEHDMNILCLDADAPSRNSNGSNSDTTSSDQSSPPHTPVLPQNNFNKRNSKSNGSNEFSVNNHHNNNNNNTNDERSNAGDSSSEEKNSAPQTSYQGLGRVINNRGRSKNPNTYTRGRGTNRRRNENMNGNNEEARKPNYNSTNTEGATFQYATNPVSATVTNATYIQPTHYLRYNPSFPANSYLRAPSHHPYTSGELVYQYPPPHALYPSPISYTPVVVPKLPSCYNCGSQGHFANDCSESTLEDPSKSSQYRLDFTPVEGTFSEK